jgi:hypothetical protein
VLFIPLAVGILSIHMAHTDSTSHTAENASQSLQSSAPRIRTLKRPRLRAGRQARLGTTRPVLGTGEKSRKSEKLRVIGGSRLSAFVLSLELEFLTAGGDVCGQELPPLMFQGGASSDD